MNLGWEAMEKGLAPPYWQRNGITPSHENKNGHSLESRVARWYIFKPKIQILVNFGVSCNERCW
jgi:hypothetical protein